MADKMQRHPYATMDMDIFGLRQRNTVQLNQGGSMRYSNNNETVLTLKDGPGSPNCPSPNLTPAENARLIDATAASIYARLEPVLAELVRRIMAGESLPVPKSYSALDAHAARVTRDNADYHETQVLREVVANMQVPLSKKIGVWGGWH